jgi:hypothetical protein
LLFTIEPGLEAVMRAFAIERIYLLVGVMVVAWPIQCALAKDSSAAAKTTAMPKGGHDKSERGSNRETSRGKGATSKGEVPKAASSVAKGATKGDTESLPKASKETKSTTIEPIETTPTAQERKHAAEPPINIVPPRALPKPTINPIPDSGVRNAIGVRVPQGATAQLPQGMGATLPVTGNANNTRVTAPKNQGLVNLPAVNRGIDGTALGRHGPATVGVGGAKPLAQINGSTMRSKH